MDRPGFVEAAWFKSGGHRVLIGELPVVGRALAGGRSVLVDETSQDFMRRSSSAWAKNTSQTAIGPHVRLVEISGGKLALDPNHSTTEVTLASKVSSGIGSPWKLAIIAAYISPRSTPSKSMK